MKKSSKRDVHGDRNRVCKPHSWANLEPIILPFYVWVTLRRKGNLPPEAMRRNGLPPEADELFEELRKPMIATAYRLFKRRGAKNPWDDARDAVQMWFVDMLGEGIDSYDFEEPAHRFAYRALRYHCRTILLERFGGLRRYDPPINDPPGQQYELDELCELIDRTVDRVPNPARSAILTKYYLGWTTERAARMTSGSVEAFEGLILEGETMLRDYLKYSVGL